MIQLHGIALSNYYNKVKFALLEYGIAFEEVHTGLPIEDEATLVCSPAGKIPFIHTEQGTLCESEVIIEYLAQRFPEKGIFPADAFQAAKLRELITFVELHLELPARDLYKQAFFGGTVTDETKARVETLLVKHIKGFKQLAKFAPYLAGDTFTIADIVGYTILPAVGMATQAVLGRDLLLEGGVDWKSYIKPIAERPAVRRVMDDRKAYVAAMQGS
ncbi:glutathione S-transferase [Trinickia fusca]|uniref:Glutathione S-transferase family protein n=1 Tax=Trinickia fusca TaxID=2419777 RepID=A0A494WYP9_9BURK|nr:glutathione S-transferase [Trinickia fusca]RKP43667.1 glutathione S-transferase family protein [Trinickia fusca]